MEHTSGCQRQTVVCKRHMATCDTGARDVNGNSVSVKSHPMLWGAAGRWNHCTCNWYCTLNDSSELCQEQGMCMPWCGPTTNLATAALTAKLAPLVFGQCHMSTRHYLAGTDGAPAGHAAALAPLAPLRSIGLTNKLTNTCLKQVCVKRCQQSRIAMTCISECSITSQSR